jgi:hypothetical protein
VRAPGRSRPVGITTIFSLRGIRHSRWTNSFAAGLEDAPGPASRFSLAIYYAAGNRERGEPPDGLTLLVMRSALRKSSSDGAFIDKLAGARSPFWVAVHDALVAISEEMHATV